MSRCRQTEHCAFYQDRLPMMPEAAEFMKAYYCRQRSERCARLRNRDAAPLSSPRNHSAPFMHASASQSGH